MLDKTRTIQYRFGFNSKVTKTVRKCEYFTCQLLLMLVLLLLLRLLVLLVVVVMMMEKCSRYGGPLGSQGMRGCGSLTQNSVYGRHRWYLSRIAQPLPKKQLADIPGK